MDRLNAALSFGTTPANSITPDVIGAVMDLADQGRCERVGVAKSKVVIVCPDDNPLVLQRRIRAGQRADDIPHRLSNPHNVRTDANHHRLQLKRFRFQICVDLFLNRRQILSTILEHRHERVAFGVNRWNADVFRWCAACG
jgi:hypothetical protein